MALHKQVDEEASDAELEINPIYFREKTCDIPRYRLPEQGVLPRTALQIVRDERGVHARRHGADEALARPAQGGRKVD